MIAKVYRDGMMRDLDRVHPQYGFASHKGYATPEHRAALSKHGPTDLHRKSFAPVAKFYGAAALQAALQREANLQAIEAREEELVEEYEPCLED